MATQQTRTLGRILIAPAVALLFVWMIVPLAMNLLNPGEERFAGLDNFVYFLTDPAFFTAIGNTLVLVGSVLLITIVLGIFVALLMNMPIYGRNIVRLMVIAPFFVMPTVSALVWKNLLMHPVSGLFAWIMTSIGLQPIDWFTNYPMLSVIMIVAWAMAALRIADLADRLAVARRGAEGSGGDGRRRRGPRNSSTSHCRIWPGRSPW